MTKNLFIAKKQHLGFSKVSLPASKSESNRLLIIDALSGRTSQIENLSEARDTQTMIRLLNSDQKTMDVIDAGTTMRFLTAYFSVTNQNKILTGTPRMKERPVHILVDALKEIGTEIQYLEKEGYPPLEISGFGKQLCSSIKIRGDVSSQFISALLLIAPNLPEGLILELQGKIGSRPYIDLTTSLMKEFGAKADELSDNRIKIYPQLYTPSSYTVESDWSGASYWYAMVALSGPTKLHLKGLRKHSFQGDQKLTQMMEPFGVKTSYEEDGVIIERGDEYKISTMDFSDNPDLAQTIAVVSALKGKEIVITGIESLRIKETDRIAALQKELQKIDADLYEEKPGHWKVIGARQNLDSITSVQIETYDDHRMAMAFAPLALKTNLEISNPAVVNKSYPNFWHEMEKAGFDLKN